jgi:hypothetical protein
MFFPHGLISTAPEENDFGEKVRLDWMDLASGACLFALAG